MSEPDARRPAGGIYVVTGAARGIGKACARLLADLGATVLLADVDEQGARATAAEIDDTGRCAAAVALDVSDADAWAAAAREAVSRFGGLDGGVLAAGIARHVPLLEMAPEDWSAMLDVHLTGAFLGVQAIGRTLVGSGRGGAIVYVGSSVVAGTGPLHQAQLVALCNPEIAEVPGGGGQRARVARRPGRSVIPRPATPRAWSVRSRHRRGPTPRRRRYGWRPLRDGGCRSHHW